MENDSTSNQEVRVTDTGSQSAKTAEKQSKRPLAKIIGLASASFVFGVILTSSGALSGIVGKKYSTSELDAAKEVSREEGISDGYTSGQSAGYKSGLLDGCNYVFTKLDTNDVIKIVYPYNRLSVIAPYWSKSTLCQ